MQKDAEKSETSMTAIKHQFHQRLLFFYKSLAFVPYNGNEIELIHSNRNVFIQLNPEQVMKSVCNVLEGLQGVKKQQSHEQGSNWICNISQCSSMFAPICFFHTRSAYDSHTHTKSDETNNFHIENMK